MADIEQEIDDALRKIYSAHPTNEFRPHAELKKAFPDSEILKVMQRQGLIVSKLQFRPIDSIENLDSWALSEAGMARAKSIIVGRRWSTRALAFATAVSGIAGTVLGSLLDAWLKS